MRYQSRSTTAAPQPGQVVLPPVGVVHVAGVDVAQPVGQRDLARPRQRRRRRRRDVAHLEVGMERGEVQRHVGAEVLGDPARSSASISASRVVVAGDQQRGDLEPARRSRAAGTRACRAPAAGAPRRYFAVEVVGERLEVDVGRVHVGVELAPRLGVDVAGGHRDRLDARAAARVGDVDRVLERRSPGRCR